MSIRLLFLLLAGLVAEATVPARGSQTPSSAEPPETHPEEIAPEPPHYASFAMAMDVPVALLPNPEGVAPALADGKPAVGEEAEPQRATVEDFVLTTQGEVRWVALSVSPGLGIGRKAFLVPSTALTYSPQDPDPDSNEGRGIACTLSLTRVELEAMPAFNRDELKPPAELDRRVAVVEAAFPVESRDPLPADTTHYTLASDWLGLVVRTSDAEFGNVSDAAFDLDHLYVDFLIVSHGGAVGLGDTQYVVPIAAVTLHTQEEKRVLQLLKSTDELEEGGVRYVQPETGFWVPGSGARAHAFFGTSPRELSLSASSEASIDPE